MIFPDRFGTRVENLRHQIIASKKAQAWFRLEKLNETEAEHAR